MSPSPWRIDEVPTRLNGSSGASSISSGMESTALFTRHEAEKRLSFYRGIVKISLQDWTSEIESLHRALSHDDLG